MSRIVCSMMRFSTVVLLSSCQSNDVPDQPHGGMQQNTSVADDSEARTLEPDGQKKVGDPVASSVDNDTEMQRVTGDNFDAVIVSCDLISRRADPCWSPAESDVLTVEYALADFVAAETNNQKILSQLGRYKRQYWGFFHGQRKHIVASFFHESTSLVKDKTWRTRPVAVSGGGDDFFSVRYDVTRGGFVELWINLPL